MNFSISKRVDFGYGIIVLVSLFSLGYSIFSLQQNKALDEKIRAQYLPQCFYLKDLMIINHKIKKLASQYINQSNDSSRDVLLKLIHEKLPAIKRELIITLTQSPDSVNDSIISIIGRFNQASRYELEILSIPYNDAYARERSLRELKGIWIEKINPITNQLDKSLEDTLKRTQSHLNKMQQEKEDSDNFLSAVLIALFIFIIIVGLIGHFHVQRKIVRPIIAIKDMIVTLGLGKTIPILQSTREDEIGEIIKAINSLIRNINTKTEFANQIGIGNYDVDFKLLSAEDIMGIALLNMRNGLKHNTETEKIRSLENRRLAMVANSTTNLVILADEKGKIVWVNPAFTSITGFKNTDVLGKNLEVLARGTAISKIDMGLTELSLSMMHGIKNLEFNNTSLDGRTYCLTVEIQPVLNDINQVVQYIVVGADISERKAAQKKLEDQNAELIKINNELDRFVYSASHDLRAPIASLLGLIEVARMEKSTSNMEGLLNRQKRTLHKLDNFIKDIVNYSRNSRLPEEPEPIDFAKLVHEILDQIQYMDNFEKIRKEIVINQHDKFYASETRISMALNNVLVNGIKYANLKREDPFLKIFIRSDKKIADIRISDNGEGILKDAQGSIFNMFYRASEKSTGSGLGLYIAKESIQKIRGSISFISNHGEGTEFFIEIPDAVELSKAAESQLV